MRLDQFPRNFFGKGLSITVPARDVAAIDLMDEAIAAFGIVRQTMFESEIVTVVHGAECASVLGDAMEKLAPVREYVNGIHGAS